MRTSRFPSETVRPAGGRDNGNGNRNRKGKSNGMAIYHLTASVGSRSTGQSAAAKFAYISREGKYSEDRPDVENRELLHTESGMMPEWASEKPSRYWESADVYERANGRLFQQIEFALPRELSREAQIELARSFALEVTNTKDGALPFTLAVHAGKGENPHAHLMISERAYDGHERSPETWFKRAATGDKSPELGGAKKTTAFQSREWIEELRESWAVRANRALEEQGREERIDHRSHADRGLQYLPTVHEGPNVRAIHERDQDRPGDLVELNKQIRATNDQLTRIEWLKDKTRAALTVLSEKVRSTAKKIEKGLEDVDAWFQQMQQQERARAQEQKPEREQQEQTQQRRGPRRGHGRGGGMELG